MKKLLLLLGLAALSQATALEDVGKFFGGIFAGMCVGSQYIKTDETKDCYMDAKKTEDLILEAFTMSSYTGGAFNIGEFQAKSSEIIVKSTIALNSC